LVDFVASVLLRVFQVGLTAEAAALLAATLLGAALLALVLAHQIAVLSGATLHPGALLARFLLRTTGGRLDVEVLAVFTEVAFLAAGAAAVQTFLLLRHGA